MMHRTKPAWNAPRLARGLPVLTCLALLCVVLFPPPAAAFVIRVAEDAFAQPPEQGFADLTRATAPTP